MTCVTCSMSSPRAATSVATRSRRRWSLKASITPSRWPWLRSPCSALTWRPRARSVSSSCAVPILVRQKMIACSGSSARSTSISRSTFSRGRDLDVGLLDRVDRELLRRHPDRHRVVHVAVGEPLDRRRDRRREQRRLAPGRTDPQDALDVVDEPEIEHLVGLVQDDVSGGCQVERPARDQVERATDRGDHHVRRLAKSRLLSRDGLTAEHRDHLDREVLGVGAQGLGHLDAELAGRGEDERLGLGGVPDRGTGASAVRTRRSFRFRSAPGRSRPSRQQLAESPAPGSGSDRRSRARRAFAGAPRTARAHEIGSLRRIQEELAVGAPASDLLVSAAGLRQRVGAPDHHLELALGDRLQELRDARRGALAGDGTGA